VAGGGGPKEWGDSVTPRAAQENLKAGGDLVPTLGKKQTKSWQKKACSGDKQFAKHAPVKKCLKKTMRTTQQGKEGAGDRPPIGSKVEKERPSVSTEGGLGGEPRKKVPKTPRP